MTWHINKGRPPRDKSALLAIEWAQGWVSKWHFTANQLRWDLTGSPFDIGRYGKVDPA
jgi:hypothetical protein